jgi:EAL domain-containing protein (putative c-di-GMP-specific phosphodiesterase class I)/ActR/RegA family two-component response regulator
MALAKETDVRRLLVVDGDLVQRRIIGTIAAKVGFKTVATNSYADARRQLREVLFDCITLDLTLGEISGAEFLHAIADQGRRVAVSIIGGDERMLNVTVSLAQSLGLYAHPLGKPLDLAALRESLVLMKEAAERPSGHITPSKEVTVADVAGAIERDEIYPEFQPKIHLASGKVVGCEALARWMRPGSGLVRPDQFIKVAEQGGLMPQLTEQLLLKAAEACAQVATHYSEFSVSVNISASLLFFASLSKRIEEALARTNLPARTLMLEVTESAALANIDATAETLVQLRLKGVGISLDDFGTGCSSLSALARLPFNELKIDQSCVKDCDRDIDHWKLVRACVLIGHEFGMKVVAEGLEHIGLRKRLSEIGCDYGQGLAFAPALDIRAFTSWEKTWRRGCRVGQAMPIAASG